MSRVFLNKQFSNYLGENRAINDIVGEFTQQAPSPTPSVTPTITPTKTVTPTPTTTPTPTPTPSQNQMIVGTGFDYATYAGFITGDTIYVGGDFNFYQGQIIERLAKLDVNGNLDTNFNAYVQAGFGVYTIEPAGDGTIFIGGAFTIAGGVATNRFSRHDMITGNQVSGYNGTNANGNLLSIASLGSGDCLIGGSFTAYNGVIRNRIARILNGNILDTTIFSGTGFNGQVNKIIVNQNGNYVIVGAFTTYNGLSANRIIEIDPNTGANTGLFGTGFSGLATDIQQDSNGDYYVVAAGTYQGSGGYIFKINSAGTFISSPATFFGTTIQNIILDEANDCFYVYWNQQNYYRKFILSTFTEDTSFASNHGSFIGTNISFGNQNIVITSQNKIILLGGFSGVFGQNFNSIIRLNSDGTNNSVIS